MTAGQFDALLDGNIQRDGHSNLANPWVKLGLVILPLACGALLLLHRGVTYFGMPRATSISAFLKPSTALLIGFLLAQSLDLRPEQRFRMLQWLAAAAAGVVLLILLAVDVVDMEKALDWLGVKRVLSALGSYLSLDDVIIFGFFVTAARGILRFGATDALLLSGSLAWSPKLRSSYETSIVTYFIIETSLSRHFFKAKMVAVNRYRLIRRERSRFPSFYSAATLFVKALLLDFRDVANLTESLLAERKWYSRDFTNRIPQGFNPEDGMAIFVVTTFVALAALLYFLFAGQSAP